MRRCARRLIVQRRRYPTTMLRMVPLPVNGEDCCEGCHIPAPSVVSITNKETVP